MKKDLPDELAFNIDGLKLYSSGEGECWPILCSSTINTTPFTVGMYYGKTKLRLVNEFLREFVDEQKHLLENKLIVNGKKIAVKIKYFVCDSLAKALVLYV